MYAKAIKILTALKREYFLQEHKILKRTHYSAIKMTPQEKRTAKNLRMKARAIMEAVYRLENNGLGPKNEKN